MDETPIACPFCGKPATQTVALSLALVENIAVCPDEGCVTAAGLVLQKRAG